MIQIQVKEGANTLSFSVEDGVKITSFHATPMSEIKITAAEWDLINQFVFDQTKLMKK